MKNAVIYRIVNRLNGEMYIGSTTNYDKRSVDHFGMLRNNKHHSIHLQRACNKYEIENFFIEIIESYPFIDSKQLASKEQYYVDNFKPKYNIRTVDVNSQRGTKRTGEVLKLISKIHSKPVYKIYLDGTYEEFPSRTALVKSLDKSGTYCRRFFTKEMTQATILKKGFYISYDKETKLEDFRSIELGERYPKVYENICIRQYDTDGNLINTWKNVHEIVKEQGRSINSIRNVLKSGLLAYNFRWQREYIDEVGKIAPPRKRTKKLKL